MIWYVGMFGSMAYAAVGLYLKPDTTITTWATDEALARELRIENGEEVELGMNYSQLAHGNVWTKAIGSRPVRGSEE